ncbi:hypothetical protein KUV62_01900 [Salipiger bermudensis]|uniref:hypothetical protein n=1 Tax=Salipiger bermudensis TaxID=344736 RepID=UPI001C99ECEB|nr:hypothetical protein [Salipiger bermudensis]MBY6002641.1 hypothetical protein [Salipiger bermudensis]
MFKPVMTAIGLCAVMVVCFALLTGVSKMDVSIKNEMQRHLGNDPLEAGDIVALSPDGTRIESLLCSVDLTPDQSPNSEIRSRYYNVLDAAQDNVFAFADRAKGLFGLERGEPPVVRASLNGLSFTGEVSRIEGSPQSRIRSDCFCDVVTAVVERKKTACIVIKSLVETRLRDDGSFSRNTVGVSFQSDPILFSEPERFGEACPDLNRGAIAPTGGSCEGASGFTFDVVARSKVGLIREVPLP